MEDARPPIEVTPEAAEQFGLRLEKRGTPEAMIRLGVRGGGCTGLSYEIIFEDVVERKGDTSWQVANVSFIVDKKSLIYLRGTQVVWLKSLMWTGFKFINPREISRCGCGESFSVA
jgi:iron-sulfur cluster assembly protein